MKLFKICPIATQDVAINLKNRNHAFKEFGYGPPNPDAPNEFFWLKKAKLSYDEQFVAAADLGYCDLFQFTCAAARTCDAWKSGGPITKD